MASSETQEELPRHSANVRSVFVQNTPIELVERILNWLDLLSLLKCRYVCSTFRNLIDSSPYFQWNVELAIAGKEDSGNHPLAASRRMLAQHQRGWVDMQWTKELRVQKERGWILHGGVLAQMPYPRSTIHIKRLPSQSRNIEERDWTIDIRRFGLDFWLIAPAQDLLVIKGGPPPISYRNFNPYIYPCPLPNQQQPFCLYDDILGLKFVFSDRTEITFRNWKTGSVLANLFSDYDVAMTVLNQKYVMFGVRTQKEPSLIVVDITTLTSECQRLQEAKNIFTFHLPPFAGSVQDISITIHSDYASTCYSDPDLPTPFFAARNRLHVISLFVQIRDDFLTSEDVLCSLSHSFLSLVDMVAGRNGAEFDWCLWGPGGTRMMLPSSASSHSPGLYGPFGSGAKYVTTGEPPAEPVDRIHICDFNQYALRQSGMNQQENASEKETKTSLPYVDVTAPTKIVDNNIFQEEIETRLGYRTKCWTIPGEPKVRYPMCVEDAIVILEEDEDFRIFTV